MPTNDDQFEHGRIPLKPLPYANRDLASTNEFIIDYSGKDATYHMYITDSNDPTKLIDLTLKIIKEILPNAKINANQFQITIEGIDDPTSLQDIINFMFKRFVYPEDPNGFVFKRDIHKVFDPATKTVLLQTSDGTIILPVTKAAYVLDDSGKSIQDRLDNMTRLGFSMTYVRSTEQNQTEFTFNYPFENYSDFVEVRIGTVYVDKSRYAIIPDRDVDGNYTSATLKFIDGGYGPERIELGRRIDILFIFNALATTNGEYEYMYGGNIADGTIPTSKLEKISDSFLLDDPTSVASSKAVHDLFMSVTDTINTNNGKMLWALDKSTSASNISVSIPNLPNSVFGSEPKVLYILLKTNKNAGCTINFSSDDYGAAWSSAINIYNPDGTKCSTKFSANSLLRVLVIHEGTNTNAYIIDSVATNNRTRYIHLCVDQETEISFSQLSYVVGDIINVYRNGVRLFEDVDYSIDTTNKKITLYVRTEDGERIIFETTKG